MVMKTPANDNQAPNTTKFVGPVGPTQKVVTNMMSGIEIVIPKDTPLCCNPASETYWSM